MKRREPMKLAGRGFTLIEVMIVILLILAIGGLVAYNLMGKKEQATTGIVKIQMQQIERALKDFHFTYDRFPTDEEGLRVLWDKEAMTDEEDLKKWTKLLEKPVPKDPWGNDWGYHQKSEHGDETTFDLWSIGPDKQEGTADDIVNWDADAEKNGTPAPSSTGGASKGG